MKRWWVIAALGVPALGACTARDDAPSAAATAAFVPDGRRTVVRRFAATVYEASGVAQLPDGRILIAADDRRHPFVVADLFGDGRALELAPRAVSRATGRRWLDDLEGLTIDTDGQLYAITSHALSSAGRQRADREVLARFGMHGDTIVNAVVAGGLKAALARLHPALAAAAEKRPKRKGAGLNIEGIAWDPTSRRVLIGFRSPLVDGSAIVVPLDNPDAAFRGGGVSLGSPILLALDGEGIRDMTYDASLGGFLIVAGSPRQSRHADAALWLWRGDDSPPVPLDVPAIGALNPEGIAIVTIGGRRALLLVCDDSRADDAYRRGRSLDDRGMPSHYVVLPYDTLVSSNAAALDRTHHPP